MASASATWTSTVMINQKQRKHFNKSNNQPVFCRHKEVASATNSSKVATS